jgi:hypothetical protein
MPPGRGSDSKMWKVLPSGDPTSRSGRPRTRLGLRGCGEGVTVQPVRQARGLQSVPELEGDVEACRGLRPSGGSRAPTPAKPYLIKALA